MREPDDAVHVGEEDAHTEVQFFGVDVVPVTTAVADRQRFTLSWPDCQ